MSVKVIKYLLEADGTVPKWIDKGGYFLVDEWLIGATVDASKRRVPKEVDVLNKNELVQWIAQHLSTDSQTAKDVADKWLKEVSVELG